MDDGLLIGIIFALMFVGAVSLLFMAAIIYKLLDIKIKKTTPNGDEAFKAIEQVNKARVAEANEFRERLSVLEERVELLGKPHSKEKELELEKVFAGSRKK